MAKHHFQSSRHRGFYSLIIVTAVMGVGTVGMRAFEGYSWVDAFYFMSMIATAQGSAITPATTGGKLFAAFMAFVAVGMVITTLGFLFGPFLGRLWHVGKLKFEEELRMIEHRKTDQK